jgi:protein-S-isoprenylcysteine O-methyltransferase Ste14
MPSSKVLPPVYLLAALVLVVLLRYLVPPVLLIPAPWNLGGIALMVVGLLLVVVPAQTFQRRGTAIKPFEDSSALVQDGLFNWSRNPMYLGMVLLVLGVAIVLRGAIAVLVPIVLAIVLDARFIRHEERALEERFGEEYRRYRVRVRKWL